MLVQLIDVTVWPALGAELAAAAHAANDMPPGLDRIAALHAAAADIAAAVAGRWEDDGRKLLDVHAVLHGDDTTPGGDRKSLHLHLVARFDGRRGSASVDRLAELVGVAGQHLEIGRRGGSPVEVLGQRITQSHDNMLAYLVHAKYPDKYQYPANQVATVRGRLPYEQVYGARWDAWVAGRAHVKKTAAAEQLEALREAVLQGRITREEILLTDSLFDVYARHSREIDDALSAYAQRRAYRAAEALRRGDFQTTIIYVWGAPGAGKTHFAKNLIADMIHRVHDAGQRWDVYRAATANPMDDWAGEEVIFLDDVRTSAMDAQDWLLLLDPVNASPARARYRNKSEVAPRVIVLTTTTDPQEFFYWAKGRGAADEPLDQFMRRLSQIVKVYEVYGQRQCSVSMVVRLPMPRRWQPPRQYTSIDLHFEPQEVGRFSLDDALAVVHGEVAKRSADLALPAPDMPRALLPPLATPRPPAPQPPAPDNTSAFAAWPGDPQTPYPAPPSGGISFPY